MLQMHDLGPWKDYLKFWSDFEIKLCDQPLEHVPTFKYFGVTFDESMTWKDHTESICVKSNKRLGLLSRIRSCLTIDASKCIFSSLVKPLLDYADTTWGSLNAGCSEKLQRLQNKGARIIQLSSSSKESHVRTEMD